MKIFNIILAGILGLGLTGHAVSEPLITHQGQNDPTTEGWIFEHIGTVSGSTSGGSEFTSSGDHNYWKVQDLSITGAQFYKYLLTDEDISQNWRFESKLRIIDSPECQNCTGVGGTSVMVADGVNYWSFYLSNNNIGPISNTGKSGQKHTLLMSWSLDTRSDYHTYVIEFSPNGAGSADDTADFFLDGILIFNDVGRTGLWPTSEKFIWFGPVGTASFSDANFEIVRFDVTAPLPEPIPCETATVQANLDIHIPSLNYQSLTGTLNLWVDFQYFGKDSNGHLIWKLKDYGENQGSAFACITDNPVSVTPDLDIHMPSLNYLLFTATLNLWANFEYYGQGNNGELLWKLIDYGENQ